MPERRVTQKVSFSALSPPTLEEIRKSEDATLENSPTETSPNITDAIFFDEPKKYDDSGSDSSSSSEGNEENYVGTYVSRYANSLSRGTEALPRIDNFRDMYSVHAKVRPTIDELHGHHDAFAEPKVLN